MSYDRGIPKGCEEGTDRNIILYVGMTVGRRAVVSFDVDLDTGCWQHGVPSGPLGGDLAVWSLLLLPGAEGHHRAHGALSEPFDAGP
jgi:hypothetical protein